MYDKPPNAWYAKIVIYQQVPPTAQDTDFSAVAFLRSYDMPVKCFIRYCTIEDNVSTGFALTGGRQWVIEHNTWSRNGKRMPSCDIDWEDGWELSIGDVCRHNTFNSESGIIFSGNQNVALLNNTFNQSNLTTWGRAVNFKILNNIFNGRPADRNLSIATGGESYFAKNILKGVTYATKKLHETANYRVETFDNVLL